MVNNNFNRVKYSFTLIFKNEKKGDYV